jgi:hypothetical protein
LQDSTERWLPVPGYEGYYEVSDHGRVRSLDRWVEADTRWGGRMRYLKPGRILREKRKKNPLHAYANVILSVNAVHDTRQVHHLVLEAFVGPCPPGMVACHGPAGLFDNSLANLRWDTDSENMRDVVRDGNHHAASREECPRGHGLAAPNLHPTDAAKGFRKCYACSLTTAWGRYFGYRQTDPEWTFEADRRYAEILHFGEPLNYRLAGIKERYGRRRWQPTSASPQISLADRTSAYSAQCHLSPLLRQR